MSVTVLQVFQVGRPFPSLFLIINFASKLTRSLCPSFLNIRLTLILNRCYLQIDINKSVLFKVFQLMKKPHVYQLSYRCVIAVVHLFGTGMYSSYRPDEVFAICYLDSLLFSNSERETACSLLSFLGLFHAGGKKVKSLIQVYSLQARVLRLKAHRKSSMINSDYLSHNRCT